MFVTNWVLEALLESQMLGTITLTEESVINGLRAIFACRDKNVEEYPTYSFWQQQYVNGTWIAWPTNLEGMMSSEQNVVSYVKVR